MSAPRIRHLLADDDLSPGEQAQVLALAARLKQAPFEARPLEGPRTVAMIFDKPTLRTQSSFAAGVAEMGGHAMMLDGHLAGIGVRESVADVARVLGRQASVIVWRVVFSLMPRPRILRRTRGAPAAPARRAGAAPRRPSRRSPRAWGAEA